MKKDLSIIVPFAGEFPQAIFTVQSIAQSLLGKLNFEIITIDNHCQELEDQWTASRQRMTNNVNGIIRKKGSIIESEILNIVNNVPRDMSNKTGETFEACSRGNEWLKYMKYDKRLSHWECKRLACEKAESDTFLFIDAHCIPSLGIDKMFNIYQYYKDQGTFHMPLTYKILEWRKLIYKLKIQDAFYGYSFTGFREEPDPYEVPAMSTCGMMISREIYEKIGGWPHHMAAYGGGENFMNYTLAVMGLSKWIFPSVTLHHHGDKRDYHYTYDGTLNNRFIAHYLFGGYSKLKALAQQSKGRPGVIESMVENILKNKEHTAQRKLIKKQTKIDLDDFVKKWS